MQIILAGFLAGTATVTAEDEDMSLSSQCLGREPSTGKKSDVGYITCAKAITPLPRPVEQSNLLQVSSVFHGATNKQRHTRDIGVVQSICYACVWKQAKEEKKEVIAFHVQQQEDPETLSTLSGMFRFGRAGRQF